MDQYPISSTAPDPAEPRAARRAVPIWLLILTLLLLYWAMLYFDQHGGWFSQEVYSPFRSVQELEALVPVAGGEESLQRGRQVFSMVCAVCHMDNGSGNPGNGCPPLVGSEWIKTPGPGRMIRIVSKGLTGPIQVNGQSYGSGTMLPIGDQLPGDEKQKSEDIAAVISYVRRNFGNVATIVTPDQVQAVRSQIKDHTTSFTSDELKAVPEKD